MSKEEIEEEENEEFYDPIDEAENGDALFNTPKQNKYISDNKQSNTDGVNINDIKSLMDSLNKSEQINLKSTNALNSMTTEKKDANFLHLQISTEIMLEKLEHFYRGDIYVKTDEGGRWETQPDKTLVTFNAYGVSSYMEIITKYIDKNTILSNYSEERIYEILADLGDELILFTLCNYVKMGMDTYFKKTKFRIIISTTLHIIESTYRRAIRGKTLEEMNHSTVIGQFGEPKSMPITEPKKKGFLERFI